MVWLLQGHHVVMGQGRGSRDATLLTVLIVLACLQIAWGVGRLLGGDWFPQGDEAIVALHTHDVFSAHPPVLGMRSTSDLSNPGVWAHHPGPMQFYLLAVPYAATGFAPWGLVVGSALIAIALVAIAVVAGFGAGGWPGAGCAAGVAAILEYFYGANLARPLNAWPPVLGLLAVLMLAWRLQRGDRRALPLYVVCASFTAQCHIGFVPVVLVLSVFLAVVALIRWWPARGWSGPRHHPRPWLVAGGLLVLCWVPPIIDVFVTAPNNVGELARLVAGSAAESPLGWGGGAKHVFLMLVPVSVFPTNLSQATLLAKGDSIFTAPAANVAVFVACALVAIAVLPALWSARRTLLRPRRRSDPALPDLVVITLVSCVALVWATATLTRSRIMYSDLLIAAPLCLTAAAVWQVARFVGERVPAIRRRVSHAVPALVVSAVCVLAAVAILPDSQLLHLLGGRRSDWRTARSVSTPVAEAIAQRAPHAPVRVECHGLACMASIAPAISTQLAADGHQVYFDKAWPKPEDDDFRRLRHAPRDAVTVVIREKAEDTAWPSGAGPAAGVLWSKEWRFSYYGHREDMAVSILPPR